MLEYFKPSHIWVGKLCFTQIKASDTDVLTPCKITAIRKNTSDNLCIEIIILGSDNTCIFAGENEIFDCIEGPTNFVKLEDSKTHPLL